jgi:hypothetical protein
MPGDSPPYGDETRAGAWPGEREARLDEREHRADNREALADNREAVANERESEADLREKLLDERERSLGKPGAGSRQQRRDGQQAAVRRLAARAGRERAGTGKAAAEGERFTAQLLVDSRQRVERAGALRRQAIAARRDAVAVILGFAAIEEEIARVHDELAARWPGRGDEYRRVAEDARTRARRARGIARTQGG